MVSQTLTTRAVITAQDGLTGKLAAMAARVEAINGRLAAAHSRMSGALPLATVGFGLQHALFSTEQYQRALFGVGAAAVEIGEDGKVGFDKMVGGMREAHDLAMKLSREMRFSPTSIADSIETLAKAGMGATQLEATARAVTTLAKADPETAAKRIADVLHTVSIIQRPNQGEGFGDFMRRQADMFNYSAASTKLGVGSILEGMRQFQTIGASMGLKTEEMLPLLEAGVQHGFGAVETGTALKSMFTRMVKRTAAGAAVLSRLGINISDEKFSGGSSLLDPMMAGSQLNQALVGMGGLRGKQRRDVQAILSKAKAEGYSAEMASGQVVEYLRKVKGLKDMKSVRDLDQIVRGSIASPEQNIKVIEVLKALVGKGQTNEQVFDTLNQMAKDGATKGMSRADQLAFFEARHDARTTAVLNWLRSGEYDQRVQALKRMQGQGLDAIEALWSKSAIGNINAMKAAFERLNIVLANSPGVQSFVNWIERMADKISQANPMLVDLAMRALVLGTAAGPILLAAMAVGKIGAMAWAAVKAVGAMNAALFLMGARGMATAGAAAAARGGLFGAMAASAAVATSRVLRLMGVLARLSGIGLAVGAGYAVFENWKEILEFLNKLGASPEGQAALEKMKSLFESLKGLGGDVLQGISKLLELLGYKAEGEGVIATLTQIVTVVGQLAAVAERAVEALRKLLTLDFAGVFPQNDASRRYEEEAEKLRKQLETLPGIGWLFRKGGPSVHEPGSLQDDGLPLTPAPYPMTPEDVQNRFGFGAGLSQHMPELVTGQREIGSKIDAGAQSTVGAINSMASKLDGLPAAIRDAVAGAVSSSAPRAPAAASPPATTNGAATKR